MPTGVLERLDKLLAYGAHSRRYQTIPEFIRQQLADCAKGYVSEQLQWDAPRYEWIDAILPRSVRSVVELGSSLGYFSLRLAEERGLTVVGFEPVREYAEASDLFALLGELQARARFYPRGVGIDDIADLPAMDCLISLNVLHHAGNVYDRDAILRFGSWLAYAEEYLRRAAARFGHMIFQSGNSVSGVAHFPSEAAIDTLVPLLERSGWRVHGIGVVTDLASMHYDSFGRDDLDLVPRIGCRRNSSTGLVDYRVGDSLLGSLAFGTLQRPLFYCVRT